MKYSQKIQVMLLFGMLGILMCLPSVALASEIVTEANLSLQQNIDIDTELDSLFGPPRPSIAYRDYTALQTEPDQPSMWPLYKQQPAFAQGDFRPLDEQQQGITSPAQPGSSTPAASPPSAPSQTDPDASQTPPAGESPPTVDIIDPSPVPVTPPVDIINPGPVPVTPPPIL